MEVSLGLAHGSVSPLRFLFFHLFSFGFFRVLSLHKIVKYIFNKNLIVTLARCSVSWSVIWYTKMLRVQFPGQGRYERQLINVSFSYWCFSLSLCLSACPSLSLPLSLKSINISSGEHLEKRKKEIAGGMGLAKRNSRVPSSDDPL